MTTLCHDNSCECIGGCGASSCTTVPIFGTAGRKKQKLLLRNGGSSFAIVGGGGSGEDLTDADLAKEMNELTVEERTKVYEELHGVASTKEETPDFIERCMEELDRSLKKLSKSKRNKMEKAIFLRPSFATDEKFKLMFLRADHYDPTKAAMRLCKYFDWKSTLFGDNKLGKDITLQDLQENGDQTIQVCVESGGGLQLPNKDPTGRPITFFDTSKVSLQYNQEMVR